MIPQKIHNRVPTKTKVELKFFVKYSLIGIMGVIIDLVVFTVLVRLFDTNVHIANFISISLGITNSFIFNILYNFKTKLNLKRRFIFFYSVGVCGFLLSTLILYIMIDIFGIDEILSKSVAIMFAVALQYTLNRLLTFRDIKS